MLKSFFVALNRSPHAMAALEHACFLAAPVHGKVHVGHVVEIIHEPVISTGLLAGTIETMAVVPPVESVREIEAFRRESAAHAAQLFEQARELCQRWDVACETVCLTGYVEEAVAMQAQMVDLVVLGQVASGPVRHIAALTEAVVRASPQPVLIATAPFTPPSALFILYDGTPCTLHALAGAAEIARSTALPLTLITAPASKEECDAVHQRACQYLRDYELAYESLVVRPHAGVERELAARIREHPAALLLMGCFGESRLREWFLGSATRPILEQTLNPAIIFHH
jgi:nucleotide-binding universal stress UspA family protein